MARDCAALVSLSAVAEELVGLHVPLQMVWPRLLHTSPRVTFRPPFTAAELMERTGLPDVRQAIIAQARSLLPLHTGQRAGA